ncbi:hypothetical protein [Lactiplantibacillus pentosus]
MTRDQAFSLAKVFGAKPQNWVTKQTDYLVVGLIETTLGEEPITKKVIDGNTNDFRTGFFGLVSGTIGAMV